MTHRCNKDGTQTIACERAHDPLFNSMLQTMHAATPLQRLKSRKRAVNPQRLIQAGMPAALASAGQPRQQHRWCQQSHLACQPSAGRMQAHACTRQCNNRRGHTMHRLQRTAPSTLESNVRRTALRALQCTSVRASYSGSSMCARAASSTAQHTITQLAISGLNLATAALVSLSAVHSARTHMPAGSITLFAHAAAARGGGAAAAAAPPTHATPTSCQQPARHASATQHGHSAPDAAAQQHRAG